jgi:16S rRNA (guanine527-N7)-methyltransferase
MDVVNAPTLPNPTEHWQTSLQWQPNAAQQAQFQRLYAHVLEGNRRLNLTRIIEPIDFWEKHLWDSLAGVQTDLQTSVPLKAIDVGTGAGFPGVPVAIVRPDWQVTLLDATRKKVEFLNQVVADLALGNVVTLVGRVEAIAHQIRQRDTYDLVLIRAVAAAAVCAEYALPLLRLQGRAILYRGQWTEAETTGLETALAELGGAIEAITPCKTPVTQSERHLVTLRKVAPTPANYPRAIGIPAHNPLG